MQLRQRFSRCREAPCRALRLSTFTLRPSHTNCSAIWPNQPHNVVSSNTSVTGCRHFDCALSCKPTGNWCSAKPVLPSRPRIRKIGNRSNVRRDGQTDGRPSLGEHSDEWILAELQVRHPCFTCSACLGSPGLSNANLQTADRTNGFYRLVLLAFSSPSSLEGDPSCSCRYDARTGLFDSGLL